MVNDKVSTLLKSAICNIMYYTGCLNSYRRHKRQGKLEILMYHKVNYGSDPVCLTVDPDFFQRQIRYLKENYIIISLAEAVERFVNETIDRDYVVITFDDGYRDNYQYAYPILQEFKVPATIFITYDAVETGTIGWHRLDKTILDSPNQVLDLDEFGLGHFSLANRDCREKTLIKLHHYLKKVPDIVRQSVIDYILEAHNNSYANQRIMLSWDEILEMQQSDLVIIGSHTLTHPILTQVPRATAFWEIGESKRLLESKIGRTVDFFAYPNGGWEDFDHEIVAMVKESGYRAACTTISSRQFSVLEPFILPRRDITTNGCRGINGKFSKEIFSLRVSGMLDGILFRT